MCAGVSLEKRVVFLGREIVGCGSVFHDLVLRDKIKSAEHHFFVDFDFDGFFDSFLLDGVFEGICLLSKEFEFDFFKLGVSWPAGIGEANKAHFKHEFQNVLIKEICFKLGKQVSFSSPDLEFLVDFNRKKTLVRVHPVYISGRYCKYSREIAQTEYFCNKCRGRGCWYCRETGHFCMESVEKMLENVVVPFFGARLLILHGAGREDMDVLMLGKGRPFILELLIPKKRFLGEKELAQIESEINSNFSGKISVNSLRLSSVKEVSPLKDSHHDKVYAALVHSNNPVEFSKIPLNKNIVVLQNTPSRVFGRRADLTREKSVIIRRVGEISPLEFVLIMRTSHGTYVKEFVSGDNNRTVPSVSSILGSYCKCVFLDVIEVCE